MEAKSVPPFTLRQWINFWKKVRICENGCLEWTGAILSSGYGEVGLDYKVYPPHRVAYEWFCGPVVPGLALDHLCSNPACVNPEHLEAVTIKENNHRSIERLEGYDPKTHFRCGHERIPANIYQGGRRYAVCKICVGAANKRYKLAHPEKIRETQRRWNAAHPTYAHDHYCARKAAKSAA